MSTTAFGLGSKYFALYEVAGVGIQWHTFSQSPVEGDDFNLLLSMMMLVVDAMVYGVLTWYIEAVHPGTCGQRGMRAPQTLQEPLCWGTPPTCSYLLVSAQCLNSGAGCSKARCPQLRYQSPLSLPLWKHLSCSVIFAL